MAGSLDGRWVLDVGCGDGALAVAMARAGARVTGLDADPRMLAAARSRADGVSVPLQLVEGQAEALPFGDAEFDLVVAVTVLCFVQQAERAVQEMARVLRPPGRLVIGELGRRNLWAAKRRVSGWLGSRTWRTVTFRTCEEFKNLVASAGLSIDQVRGAIFYPPCGVCAGLVAPVDPWLGRQTTAGAAFLAIAAMKSDRPIA
jgi:ubiquinone/menaquinone biosynthesis C-methylase UbiE